MTWTHDQAETRTLGQAATSPIVEGGMFADRYAIERRLGEGAHAVVYVALDMLAMPPQRVALKVTRSPAFGKANLEREATVLARIHEKASIDGVVRLLEPGVHEQSGVLYLVLECIDGPALRAWMHRGPLGLPDVCRVGEALARTLARVHEMGLVIADVKPENIVMHLGTEPAIVDVGATRAMDESDAPAFLTPAYAAPEQHAGLTAQPSSDVYALARILDEMVLPLRSRHLASILAACTVADPNARPAASTLAESLNAARLSYVRASTRRRMLERAAVLAGLIGMLAFLVSHACSNLRGGPMASGKRPVLTVVSTHNSAPPQYLALGDQHVYWSDGDGGTVFRALLRGGSAEIVTHMDKPVNQIALSGQTIFIRCPDEIWSFAHEKLERVAEAAGRGDIVADERNVFWTNDQSGDVVRLDLQGEASVRILAPRQSRPYAISLDTTHVYWASEGEGSLARVPRDGGQVEVLARRQSLPVATALDETHLYWIDRDAGSVMRVPKQGGEPTHVAQATIGSYATALDETHIYWTSFNDGRVLRAIKSGGAPEVLVSGRTRLLDLVARNKIVYFTEIDNGGVMRLVMP